MKAGKIFIHHDGALGDTLLSLPCIGMIRESASHIHIAGRRDVVHFLKEAEIADEVSSADSLLYSSLYTKLLDESITSFLSGFDRAYIFTVNTESQPVRNIRAVIPDTRAILTIPPEAGTEHAAGFRVAQCGQAEDAAYKKAMIRIPDAEMVWATGFLREQGHTAGDRIITVHSGSGGKKKCWPLDNYTALIRWFMKHPRNLCIILTGPAEDAATLKIIESLSSSDKRIVHIHDAPLIDVAALLERSSFYIGNDSGISHLAGIMKCRGAVLFGPTDPRIWRPMGSSIEIVHFDGRRQSATAQEIKMLLIDNRMV